MIRSDMSGNLAGKVLEKEKHFLIPPPTPPQGGGGGGGGGGATLELVYFQKWSCTSLAFGTEWALWFSSGLYDSHLG